MDAARLKTLLEQTAARDPDVAAGLELVGLPPPRLSPPGFGTLLNTIISQQISKQAAGAIRGRIEALNPTGRAEGFAALSDDALRGAGLSRPKIAYARGLADAVVTGALDLDAVARLPDSEAVSAIMSLKGFGRWSAEIYCMFALRREDLFPGEDIALQEAMRRLKDLEARPTAKAARALAEAWSPARSAMAVFLWHYYRGAPQSS
jgi:DNA-3-methyladenine glycosylase II